METSHFTGESEKIDGNEKPVVTSKLSAIGANPNIPDMTAKAQNSHRHHIGPGNDFPDMKMDEYIEKGREFARKRAEGDIEGYRGEDGCIVRYNNSTGEWVQAYDTGVASYMRPILGKQYYEKWLKFDKGVTNDD
jgi:hypothetical protein